MNALENIEIRCPYCGEPVTLLIDTSAGGQRYIEDCQICCRPIDLHVSVGTNGDAMVTAARDDT
ncbi:MAG TPA: CPXCG motif-containing cysteine-rich protein [Mariprofundaceae bacterium]|nr:CPXCG motif-containing cysteine-rich protein [Mariprofundaceae bacterium]